MLVGFNTFYFLSFDFDFISTDADWFLPNCGFYTTVAPRTWNSLPPTDRYIMNLKQKMIANFVNWLLVNHCSGQAARAGLVSGVWSRINQALINICDGTSGKMQTWGNIPRKPSLVCCVLAPGVITMDFRDFREKFLDVTSINFQSRWKYTNHKT